MRPIFLLALCQGFLLTNGVTMIAVTGLAGLALAPHGGLATLPLTTYVLGGALSTVPAALFMRRFGRRNGFMLGTGFGLLGALTCALAVGAGQFVSLCLGTLLSGVYTAFGQQYRFAAADAVAPEWKARAISWTLAGGILGGIVGPELGKLTRDLLTPTFTATYGVLALVALAALAVASRLDIPPLSAEERKTSGRPLAEIIRQPAYLVAALAATSAYGVMNLLMTATPLAMDICRHPFGATALVLEWHVIGMFAPSFFTGHLIKRFGVLGIIGAGTLLMTVCIAIALSGVTLMHFWWALLLLGIGWNFMFVGGTTLLTETYRPEEKAKAQGSNDFIVFAAQGLTSLSSGFLISHQGWITLNWLALPVVLGTAGVTLYYGLKQATPKSGS